MLANRINRITHDPIEQAIRLCKKSGRWTNGFEEDTITVSRIFLACSKLGLPKPSNKISLVQFNH